VASENLGRYPGLLAAAALMLDYVLTAAVGISAGVGALVSAVPQLQPHTLSMCLGILLIVTIVNLRGVRETGVVFMIPTYAFVGSLMCAIIIGITKTVFAGGHPVAVVAPPHSLAVPVAASISLWLLLQVFSNGCTAMTGVEAVSNGVRAFREPPVKNAQRTLTVIIALLAVLLAGIAYLVRAYGIQATDPGQPGYQSVLSLLVAAVIGRGWFYYFTIGSVLLILSLSANTAFADFPRLCKVVAHDGFLPHSFGYRRPDPAFRDWSLSRLHTLAGGNGRTLAQNSRPGIGSQHVDKWIGRHCDGVHVGGRTGGEVYLRRLDQHAADCRHDGLDAMGAATLRLGRQRGAELYAPAAKNDWAPNRNCAHSIVDHDFAARHAICADAFTGNSRRTCQFGR
jgi:hypothetical protein